MAVVYWCTEHEAIESVINAVRTSAVWFSFTENQTTTTTTHFTTNETAKRQTAILFILWLYRSPWYWTFCFCFVVCFCWCRFDSLVVLPQKNRKQVPKMYVRCVCIGNDIDPRKSNMKRRKHNITYAIPHALSGTFWVYFLLIISFHCLNFVLPE